MPPQVLAGHLATQLETGLPRLTCIHRCGRVVKFLRMVSEQKQNVQTRHLTIKNNEEHIPLSSHWLGKGDNCLVRFDPRKETA